MSLGNDVDELIRKNSLANAIKHGGKCNPQAVLGKVLGETPSLKENIKEVINLINDIAEQVNQISLEEQKNAISKYNIVEKTIHPEKEETFASFTRSRQV